MWLPALAAVDKSFQTSATTLTAHADVHTKGSWVELVASTPFDMSLLGVAGNTNHGSNSDTSQLVDIAIGAESSEIVLIDNIPSGYSSLNIVHNSTAWFPVEIPASTRIAARMQAKITVDVVDIQLFMFGGSTWTTTPAFQSIDTLGALTASSHGTQMNSSTIVEIIASTAHDYKALGWGVDGGGDTNLGAIFTLAIYVGAGAAEKVLVDGLHVNTQSQEQINTTIPSQGIIPLEFNIPSGSRLSAKNSAGSSDIGVVLYGFR